MRRHPFGGARQRCRVGKWPCEEELAFRTDLHRTHLSQLKRRLKGDAIKTVSQLAKAFGLTASELIRRAEGFSG